MKLSTDQLEAISEMKNGCVLCGGVGSGKSRTALAYYLFKVCHGRVRIDVTDPENWVECNSSFKLHIPKRFSEMTKPRDLYIITTAKKRETEEWVDEAITIPISNENRELSHSGVYMKIDSWNNIKKYRKIHSAFFIFDEQRVVGSGEWVKAFLDIARKNQWILLSATPGDSWSDYIPVFIANGFYKNRTEFQQKHCVYSRFSKYPKIERYIGLRELNNNRNEVLVNLKDRRFTTRINIDVSAKFDVDKYLTIQRDRWDPYENKPIEDSSQLCYKLRRVVNEDSSRINSLVPIILDHEKVIIFYNFNYELRMLREFFEDTEYEIGEWNGVKHQNIPKSEKWVYLVQYLAGSEGWNCTETNCIVFYSQTYSYKTLEQACGRIDRMNTPFDKLYYYHIVSKSPIDNAIRMCLKAKKNFNERKFAT